VAGLNRHVLRGSLMFNFNSVLQSDCSDTNLAVEQTGERSRIKFVFLLLDALVERGG
ncbi:uncharacterized protein METZ01_LOCUS159698, partial [marine metagenome]